MIHTPISSAGLSASSPRRAFTIIEIITVMGIIVLLVGITIPAIKSLSKSNDTSQATNIVRSMISSARSIAISQHRMVGVVFFEETSNYSKPANSGVTAMQLFAEEYNQPTGMPNGLTVFSQLSTARQYLPAGTRIATLSDSISGINTSEAAASNDRARAVLFDANGQLITRDGLATFAPGLGGINQGSYPVALGDWNFLIPTGTKADGSTGNAYSSPGFFLYNKTDMDAQTFANDASGDLARAAWLKKNASVIIVNANTGGILR